MKSFIFDMDGVIADTEPLHEKVWRNFFKSKGVSVSDDDLLSMKGKSGVAVIKTFMPKEVSNEEAQKLRNERAEIFFEEIKKGVQEVNGFKNFFDKLKDKDIKVAVATSAEKERAEIILEQIGILKDLKVLVTASDVEHSKPDPEIFLKAAEKLQVRPSDCYVFEDSMSGIKAAQNAQMTPVLIMTSLGKENFPDVEFAYSDFNKISLEELL